ncbi:ABC transporter ATP-binding protein [Beggiatoa alba]|uniref:ABC transporter ATP-binding protein n=1 Tax=Beggiatoa alba TaxID=1022 RepID=UPI0009D9CCC5|nr:ABC transporter ATP-binding protein [Beggiatoa alba]
MFYKNRRTQVSLDRGIVFQDYSLFPWMSMVDNIALAIGKAQPQIRKAEQREQAQVFLKQVGLQDAIGKYPFELSGGMRQRGAIARALALGSPILLMDEPFGALDPINRARLQDLLLDVWQSTTPRKTIVFVTHDVDEAIYLADRVAILGSSPGHLIAQKNISFARPRVRNQLFTTDEFHLLREEISEILSADTIARLNLTPST